MSKLQKIKKARKQSPTRDISGSDRHKRKGPGRWPEWPRGSGSSAAARAS